MGNILISLLLWCLLAGCGGGGGSTPPAVLSSITILPANVSLAVGTTASLRANGNYSDGTVLDLTNQVTWSSSQAAVEVSNAVGAKGVVTAVSPGSATITASSGSVNGSTIVTAAAVQSISVTPPSATGIVGTTQQFTATATLSNGATQNVTSLATWSSSDNTLATVNASGLATPVGVGAGGTGAPMISASFGGVTGSTTFNTLAVSSLTITPTNPTIDLGATQQLQATATLSNGSQQTLSGVSWSSGNTSVALVSGSGLVTTRLPGTSNLTASFQGVTSAPATLTVQAPSRIVVTPANSATLQNSTVQFAATGFFTHGASETSQDLTQLVNWSSPGASFNNLTGPLGLATITGTGSIPITATLAGTSVPSATTTLTVSTLTGLDVLPQNTIVGLRSTQQLSAIGTLSGGGTIDVTSRVTWSSDNSAVASVSSTGLVSGNAVGSARITATFGNVFSGTTASTTVTVTQSGPSTANNSVFVTNFGSGTVSALNLATTVVTPVQVGNGPQQIAINTDTGRAYVANGSSNSLSIINLANNAAGTVPLGGSPWGVAVEKVGTTTDRIYVTTNQNAGSLSVLNGSTGAVIETIPVGPSPRGVVLVPGRNRAYVVNSGNNTVSVVSTNTTPRAVIDTVPVGAGPTEIALDPTSGRLLVANSFGTTITVIDPGNNNSTSAISVVGNPQGITVNAATGRAYVASSNPGTISTINTGNNTVIRTLSTGGAPLGVAARLSTNLVYLVDNAGNALREYNPVTNSIVQSFNVQGSPQRVAVVP